MFVSMKSTLKMVGLISVMTVAGATVAVAQNYDIKSGTIPVTVELANVQTAAGPIYVSIQKRDQYMGMKGFGGVIKTAVQGDMTGAYMVDVPGEYAVSVWHDLDDDGVFDMDETYRPTEGWGSSGNVPTDKKPEFDDVKIDIGHAGATVPVTLGYGS